MIVRLAVAATVAAGLALSATGADAAPVPTLDGKKTKTISFTAVGAPQANDVPATVNDLNGVERVYCEPPLCAYKDFVFKPAKGVKAVGLAFESSWTTPVGVDIDLYVAALDRHGDPSDIGHCGASYCTHEQVYLLANNFKPGKKYRMIAYFYRTANETVTTKVTFNGADTIPTTVPSEVDSNVYVNCGL
jgi:hypothetical protein